MTTEEKEKFVLAIKVNKNDEQCIRILDQYAEAYVIDKRLKPKKSVNCDCPAPNYRDKNGNHRCTECNALNNSFY